MNKIVVFIHQYCLVRWKVQFLIFVYSARTSHFFINFNNISYFLISVLQTIALKSGALRHDIHYWLGKDTSQVNFFFVILYNFQPPYNIIQFVIWPCQLCLNRMKLVLQQSRPLNWMQLLVGVLFSIVKYKAMKLRSSFLILNHVLYLKKAEFLLDLSMLRLKSTRRGCMFAKESMLFA